MDEMRDYVEWHKAYDDPTSALSARLRQVQASIEQWLDANPGPRRVVSSCAGQGNDILGVLERRPQDRARISGGLVELDPTNAGIARERVEQLGLDLVVRQADASTTDAYLGLVPADLVLLCGIMGNISAADIERLIHTARQFCAPGATVIWTRGAQTLGGRPDNGTEIRGWFRDAGFDEVDLVEQVEGTRMRVGVNQLVAAPEPLRPGQRIFTFTR